MNSLELNTNKSTADDIVSHLMVMDGHFTPPLHTYVDIIEYAKKLAEKSVRFEIWVNGELMGLLAGYYNNEDVFYISNYSVCLDLKGQKAALRLLELAICDCRERRVPKLILEVRRENEKAIRFYERQGFVLVNSLPNTHVYQKTI